MSVPFLITVTSGREGPVSNGLGCAHGAALLKAFAAENGTPLRGTEGHRSLLAALRTIGFGFGAHRGVAPSASAAFGTLGFASLAALGLVFEALVRKKHLFARS